jgi:hypothetical protein
LDNGVVKVLENVKDLFRKVFHSSGLVLKLVSVEDQAAMMEALPEGFCVNLCWIIEAKDCSDAGLGTVVEGTGSDMLSNAFVGFL